MTQPAQQTQQQKQKVQQEQDQNNHDPRETEQDRKYRECCQLLLELEKQQAQVLADLDEARACKQPTGPIYAEKQKLTDEMEKVCRERDRCRPAAAPQPAKPNLTDRQFILSTSSVGRNDLR
jgi:16S rRNA G1207 methylase RsmC